MQEKKNGLTLITAVVVAIFAVSTILSFAIPYVAADSAIPGGELLTLHRQEDGMLLLEWPAAADAAGYTVELAAVAEGETGDLVFQEECAENHCLLRAYPEYDSMRLRIRPEKRFHFLFWEATRRGEVLELSARFDPPEPKRLRWTSDPASATVFLLWEPEDGAVWRLYQGGRNETLRLLDFLEDTEVELRFTAELGRPMPTEVEQYRFALDAYREEGRLASFGFPLTFTVGTENFGERSLVITDTDLGGNVHSLSWNTARAKNYRLQRFDEVEGVWKTEADYIPGEDFRYVTEQMAPYSSARYRVLAMGSTDASDPWYTVEPAEMEVKAGATFIYTTIWPLKNVEYYASAEDTYPAGTLYADDSYTVVGASSDRFLVRLESGENAWVECRWCLINLPDFLGDLCEYDIRNSYSSAFTVHEYAIPGVTGAMLEGYQQVRVAEGSYLVPLLYPAAVKLMRAAEAAAAEGYRLKIYDAFRPETATRSLYNTTSSVLQNPLPTDTVTGRVFPALPDPGNGMPLTYNYLMTNGWYNLGNFLSASGSTHNYGLAVDVALVSADGGWEPAMQTIMHDLSWYSATSRNTEAADTLHRLMTDAGFQGIDSEWWHFQDDAARYSGTLATRWMGVTARGWQGDAKGWKYRLSDGSYYTNTVAMIGGVFRTFDAAGYLTLD